MKQVFLWTGVCVVMVLIMIATMIPKARVETQTYNELCNDCGYNKFTARTSILSIESSADLYVYECGRNNFMLTTIQNNILDCDIRN